MHDSNTAQTQNGPSANLFAFAYGVDVNSGRQNAPGGFYGFNLRGQYFVYDNAVASLGVILLRPSLPVMPGSTGDSPASASM